MNSEQFTEKRILLVEDEESLALGLEYNLSDEGFKVDWAKDGKQALDMIAVKVYDLILLDLMLPYYDGFEIVSRVRENDPQMPILILTARASAEDKVKGLEMGADDYMIKPFHLEELILRIKGMLKRKAWYQNSTENQKSYSFGNNKINFENFNCTAGSNPVTLTQLEAMVLKYLIERKGKIVTRKELLENVWHLQSDVETRTVDIFISRLRKYFEADSNNPTFIKSVRSVGYVFEDDVEKK